jgi:hypothetical protein
MHQHLAGGVEDADVHRLHVKIDSAIVPMLTVVESHSVLLLRGMRTCPALKPTCRSGAGGGLNKNQALEAAGARRLRNGSFTSAPQLKRGPLGGPPAIS